MAAEIDTRIDNHAAGRGTSSAALWRNRYGWCIGYMQTARRLASGEGARDDEHWGHHLGWGR